METRDTLLDRVCEKIARAVAVRSTRRSFLSKAARITFAVLGIELVVARPRLVASPAAAADWQKCGAYGKLCQTDFAQASDFLPCPDNCNGLGGQWTACCKDPERFGFFRNILYYDCFLVTGEQPACGTKTEGSKVSDPNRPCREILKNPQHTETARWGLIAVV